MVKQYPYFLYAYLTGTSTQDSVGNWIETGGSWTNISVCRDETNTRANQITLQDETAYVYESLIQLPVNCQKVESDIEIEVRDSEGNVRVKGKCRRFSKDQLHCRLWL